MMTSIKEKPKTSAGDGGGDGTPLQYSCLENPRDGGAWWAAIHGVTQSWTRLKLLSSSSSSAGEAAEKLKHLYIIGGDTEW